jgi:hypothetical protein
MLLQRDLEGNAGQRVLTREELGLLMALSVEVDIWLQSR